MNLPNNHKTKILRFLCFKFLALGNGDDDDVPKLPEESLKLEVFGKLSTALVLIVKLFILSGKRWR
jgi:hypothetical protein